ncbi:uncharacterized protein LOC127706354 [Mytilus californianus]|uniref:uncharacterized protein LOC127706354 n=1 Tax=Mytilus californianus TaxID=6549 RepID=UPI002247D076|nr:uncharacterized protein LOC127706354 [Mytilus californianus]
MENRVAHIRNIQTYVQELSITRMGISDIQTIVFPDLKHLHILEEIYGLSFKDVLKRCPKLQAIDIHMYNPMICSFDLFCGLNLKEIKISFLLPTSETINNDLIFLTEANPNLEKLDLNVKVKYGNVLHCGVHLQLEDHTIRQILNQSRNLKTLALRNCSVSSKGFTSCGINLGLTELTISNSYLFDDNGIECVTKNAKNLLVLEILECNKITDKSIASIAENCPRLQCLSIYHPHVGVQITNESLLAIANACRNLKRLYWRFRSKNRNTMDSGVIAIANSCRFLVKISFDNNVDIGDLSLSSIATYCLFLREVSFSGCYGITFKGVKSFISSCIWLEKLDCSFCEGIMDDDYSTVTTNTRKSNEPRETTDETKSNQDKPEEFYNRADGCVQDDVAIPYTDPQTERVFIRHHYHDQDDRSIVHSHLKYLSLKACRLLSNVTILTLFELCPDLREVDLIGTNADIDQLLYDRIKQLCPFLNLENSQVPP